MSKTFPKKIDQNFDVSFPSDLFYRLFGVFLSDGTSKTLKQKTFCKKHRVEKSKSFYKKFDQKPKTDFSRFFYHVFGRFSVRGVKNATKKYRKNKSHPVPFSYSDPPTTGVTDFFLPAPWPLLILLQLQPA
jgi:hypothetical protein